MGRIRSKHTIVLGFCLTLDFSEKNILKINHQAVLYPSARDCQADCVTAYFTYKESVAPQIRWQTGSSPAASL